jgi:hypothetical protein
LDVTLALNGEVDGAEGMMEDGKRLVITCEEDTDHNVTFAAILGSEDAIDADILNGLNFTISKKATPQEIHRAVGDAVLSVLKPAVWNSSEGMPETVQDVPTMDKGDVSKHRDQFLDEMNKHPEGSPEREQAKDKLRGFGSRKGSRFAMKVMAAESYESYVGGLYTPERQHDDNIDSIVMAVGKKHGHIDTAQEAVEALGPQKAAEKLIAEVWPELDRRLGAPGRGEDDYWDQSEAVEEFAKWLSGAYYWN